MLYTIGLIRFDILNSISYEKLVVEVLDFKKEVGIVMTSIELCIWRNVEVIFHC